MIQRITLVSFNRTRTAAKCISTFIWICCIGLTSYTASYWNIVGPKCKFGQGNWKNKTFNLTDINTLNADQKIHCENETDSQFKLWLWSWSSYAFFFPIIVISVCYGQVLCKISETIKNKNDLASHHSALLKRRAVRMVGYLIATYLICRGPFFLYHLVNSLIPIPVPNYAWCIRMHHFLAILVYISSTANATLYSFCNPRFLKSFDYMCRNFRVRIPHSMSRRSNTQLKRLITPLGTYITTPYRYKGHFCSRFSFPYIVPPPCMSFCAHIMLRCA